jgi:hypothetical protein
VATQGGPRRGRWRNPPTPHPRGPTGQALGPNSQHAQLAVGSSCGPVSELLRRKNHRGGAAPAAGRCGPANAIRAITAIAKGSDSDITQEREPRPQTTQNSQRPMPHGVRYERMAGGHLAERTRDDNGAPAAAAVFRVLFFMLFLISSSILKGKAAPAAVRLAILFMALFKKKSTKTCLFPGSHPPPSLARVPQAGAIERGDRGPSCACTGFARAGFAS